VKQYVRWQAKALNALHVTKSLRSEYDHLMLQLHDAMKSDLDYQKNARQVTFGFPPGCAWVCFSDQASHCGDGGAVHDGAHAAAVADAAVRQGGESAGDPDALAGARADNQNVPLRRKFS
jgi:hypothetical protein